MSKGSKRRPQFVEEDELADHWWQTFGEGEAAEHELVKQGTKGDSKTHPIKERTRERR